jgi:hypothetical protein
MSDDDVLVDTDVFVDHLRGAHRLKPPAGRVAYSSVTRCELFAGRRVDEDVVRTLLDPFHEIPVDREVAEHAGRIRRDHDVRTPDALIAATALLHDATLWTNNVRDFERVPGLKIGKPRP